LRESESDPPLAWAYTGFGKRVVERTLQARTKAIKFEVVFETFTTNSPG
jgi:hypothetical protein